MATCSMPLAEQWKSVAGWQDYEVSNFGRIRSFKRRSVRVLKPRLSTEGYPTVILYGMDGWKNLSVHRLVALAFIPNPANLPEVNHLDGIKVNCWVGNLEWTTKPGNVQHSFALGLQKPLVGPENASFRLTDDQIQQIRFRYNCPCVLVQGRKPRQGCSHGDTVTDLAKEFGCTFQYIWSIVKLKVRRAA